MAAANDSDEGAAVLAGATVRDCVRFSATAKGRHLAVGDGGRTVTFDGDDMMFLTVAALGTEPLSSGTHVWTVKVHSHAVRAIGGCATVGVVAAPADAGAAMQLETENSDSWFFDKGSVGYTREGLLARDRDYSRHQYGYGVSATQDNVVTVVLDYTGGDGGVVDFFVNGMRMPSTPGPFVMRRPAARGLGPVYPIVVLQCRSDTAHVIDTAPLATTNKDYEEDCVFPPTRT